MMTVSKRPSPLRAHVRRIHKTAPGRIVRLDSDSDDIWQGFFRPGMVLDHLTVFEEDEPAGYKSPILDANGKNIVYGIRSQRQPFMGFVDFRTDEEKEEDGDLDDEGDDA